MVALLGLGCVSLLIVFVSYRNSELTIQELGKSVPRDPREIHFVPTPMPVLNKMLEYADITPEDVVLDLGCGDGRLVIQAAKRFGCRGRGYDIDPELVETCKRNARQEGVEELVEFHVQDIYELDIHDATVITLYLLPEMNLRLLPQLQTLADGSRVISHDFEVPGVSAEQIAAVEDKTGPIYMHGTHQVYLYRAPLLLDPNYQPEGLQFVKALDYVRERNVRMSEESESELGDDPSVHDPAVGDPTIHESVELAPVDSGFVDGVSRGDPSTPRDRD